MTDQLKKLHGPSWIWWREQCIFGVKCRAVLYYLILQHAVCKLQKFATTKYEDSLV